MNWIGESVLRLEDDRHVRGRGQFTDDIQRLGQGYACFLRSDIAHGDVAAVDVSGAEAMPGVRLVLHALSPESQCRFPNLGSMPGQVSVNRPVMARQVRHVGEILAMVVADSPMIATEALARISVDIDELPTLNKPMAYSWELGDKRALDCAFAQAAWVAEVSTPSQRVVVHPMETRSALAVHDTVSGQSTLFTSSQGVHKLRQMIASALSQDPESLRVVTPDVGGAFGMKLQPYPEQALVVLAAQMTGQPVKWTATRQESSLMDAHGRAQVLSARLALDETGRFLALAVNNEADLGAYATGFGSMTPSLSGSKVAGHVYNIGTISINVRVHYSNTSPVDAYRGAGKPEMVYILERAIEEAARISGIDRVELRRRNLLKPGQLPHEMPLGQKLDCGMFEAILDEVLQASEWLHFEERRKAAHLNGKLRGIGLGFHMHVSGGFTNEISRLQVLANKKVRVFTGSQSGGQGHETLFAQIVANRLCLEPHQIEVCQGDSGDLSDGGGTGGSSTLPIAGVNIARASEELLTKAQRLAAERLEAAAADISYAKGVFQVVGTDRGISFFELAQNEDLSFGCNYKGDHVTFPNGAYVAELEIDKETGTLELIRFTGVDDIGVVYNPLIARGQIQGGVAQGLGQALMEHGIYDDNGQMLSATLMDYALPRALDLCDLDCNFRPVPTGSNALGAKGAGELGTAGALAPLINAALDALRDYRVRELSMPLTSEKIWRAMHPED